MELNFWKGIVKGYSRGFLALSLSLCFNNAINRSVSSSRPRHRRFTCSKFPFGGYCMNDAALLAPVGSWLAGS